MGRYVAVVWHASFSIIAAGLYFFFVLPRWWELTGFTPHLLGTVLRIVTGVLIALAALPVVFTLLRTRRPEYGTPELALRLLVGSIVAQVLAGVLIVGTAISEIWLSLDDAGQWLFGIYGAAAAIALLGIGAFYLSFVAELPPPPPKPLKPKKAKQRGRLRRKGRGSEEGSESEGALEEGAEEAEEAEDSEAVESPVTEGDESAAETDQAETDEAETETVETETGATTETAGTDPAVDSDTTELVSAGSRQKRRPAGKRRTRNRR